MKFVNTFAILASIVSLATCAPASTSTSTSSSAAAASTSTVTFDGRTFVNKGLVGFGRIDASAVDSYGETIGGVGSSIFVESLLANKDGTFSGSVRLNPDRGHNTVQTTDYRARSQYFDFSFNPSIGNSTTENVKLTYKYSNLYRTNPGFNYTTGLDAIAVRPAQFNMPALPSAPSDNHISFDTEGWAPSNIPGISFVSDEYGPYIYTVQPNTGIILAATAPPAAILPMINGILNFTSQTNPTTGRAPNQGFEGLTFDHSTSTLWALLQSATIQDSNQGSKQSNRFTRLFGYDASDPFHLKLKSEYVVPLPQSGSGKTYAQSELHIIDRTTFLVLARDGNGYGDTNSQSSYKDADLFSIKNATNIAGSKYDQPTNPITPDQGKTLNSDITPATYQKFISLIDPTNLAKFGLHNGGAIDKNLIASKLESLALANVVDPKTFKNTGDQFLFVCSDNDFITANGNQASQQSNGKYVVEPYSDPYAVQYGVNGDTQFFIYRVSLPGYDQGFFPN